MAAAVLKLVLDIMAADLTYAMLFNSVYFMCTLLNAGIILRSLSLQ